MRTVKLIRKYIEKNPEDADARLLAEFVLALQNEAPFDVHRLYQLRHARFEEALKLLQDWRLDRYYASKSRLVVASHAMVGDGDGDAGAASDDATGGQGVTQASPEATSPAHDEPTGAADGSDGSDGSDGGSTPTN